MTIVLSGDISLNHGALVQLNDGSLKNYWYYTNSPGSANASKHGYRINPEIYKIKDHHILGIRRLLWIKEFIGSIVNTVKPDYFGIEDYALGAVRQAHYLGEVGAVARLIMLENSIKMRLHDPISVKLFVAHDGTCQKDSIERAVEHRWGVDFSDCNVKPSKSTAKRPNPKQNRTTSEDLCDAFGVGQMVWTEIRLRKGLIALKDLPEKEVRVFTRITKAYPMNLLDREWIV